MVGHPGSMVVVAVLTVTEPAAGAVGSHGIALVAVVGGKVLIGPDKNVYAVIGDLRNHRTQAQNIASGGPPDLTSEKENTESPEFIWFQTVSSYCPQLS